MYYVSEQAIRRLIKYKGYPCSVCEWDRQEQLINDDWGYVLDEEHVGYTAHGELRSARVDCKVYKAFREWEASSKHLIRYKKG